MVSITIKVKYSVGWGHNRMKLLDGGMKLQERAQAW